MRFVFLSSPFSPPPPGGAGGYDADHHHSTLWESWLNIHADGRSRTPTLKMYFFAFCVATWFSRALQTRQGLIVYGGGSNGGSNAAAAAPEQSRDYGIFAPEEQPTAFTMIDWARVIFLR